jgi:hypothetical protein
VSVALRVRAVPEGEVRENLHAASVLEFLGERTLGGRIEVYLHLRDIQNSLELSCKQVQMALANLSKRRLVRVGPYRGAKARKFELRRTA